MRKLIFIGFLIGLYGCATPKTQAPDSIGVNYVNGIYTYCNQSQCIKPSVLTPITADELKPLTPDIVVPPIITPMKIENKEVRHRERRHYKHHRHHKHKRHYKHTVNKCGS